MFVLSDGTVLELSSGSAVRVLDVEDLRARNGISRLDGTYRNINFDKGRWFGNLEVVSLNAADGEVMKKLAAEKVFTISANSLVPAGSTHSRLPFLAGGKVNPAGNLLFQTSGRAAHRGSYSMRLPLILLEELSEDKEFSEGVVAAFPGRVFDVSQGSEELAGHSFFAGVDLGTELLVRVLEDSYSRATIDYLDGSHEEVPYERVHRTAISITMRTTNPMLIDLAKTLRVNEAFRLYPTEYAKANMPTSLLPGLDPDLRVDLEMVGGLKVNFAEGGHNYQTGLYSISFNANVVAGLFITPAADELFMRDFVEFMFDDENWRAA